MRNNAELKILPYALRSLCVTILVSIPEDDFDAFQEEDVPGSEQVVEGESVGKKGDEPVAAKHGRKHSLLPQVTPQPRDLHHGTMSNPQTFTLSTEDLI